MERHEIKVESREETGKGVARQLRRSGKIPGVIYGKERESQPLTVDPGDIKARLNSNAIFDIKIVGNENETETAMIKDYQKDVIKGKIIHVDFQQISMDEKISVTVPVRLVGESIGVQEGGVLQQLKRDIEIESLPADIPDELELDISELEVGDSLQISDFQVSDKIDILDSLDEVVVTVVTPSEEIEEEEEELEEEFVEPEVIGEEEEGEELEEEEEMEEEEETQEDYY